MILVDLWKWFKEHFFPFHFIIAIVFVISGLIVCFLMLITYILLWRTNKCLYRKIITYLAYTHWSQFTFLGQWWSGSDCVLIMENPEDYKYLGNEHSIVVMNHKYDIDWMMGWILSERLHMLGSTKVYGKQSLKMVPLLGWAWVFAESIFLKREWDKDKETIARDLKYVRDFPDGYWLTLLLFCEGTRFTAKKHASSVEYARKHNLPILKHHLSPRTKGFVHSLYGLRGKVPAILDITIGFSKDAAPPTLMSIIQGKACRAQMYMRRIPLNTIPIESEACTEWIQNLYQEKDNFYEDFVQNGRFTKGTKINIPKRPLDLICWLLWTISISVPLLYYTLPVLVTGTIFVKLTALLILIIGYIIIRKMISVSEIEKTSSTYGYFKKSS